MITAPRLVAVVTAALLANASVGQERIGLDPRDRDEDISGTTVVVSIEEDAAGHFVYEYRLTSSSTNLGTVSSLDVDVACPEVGDRGALPPQRTDGVVYLDASLDTHYAPLNMDADFGSAGVFGIDVRNQAGWLISLAPGEAVRGLRLISPNPPVSRAYVLDPAMGPSAPWDYSDVDPSDETIPWVDDFTVFGVIEGPGCEQAAEPPPEPARFAGTPSPFETDGLNDLLSYSQPLRDRVHAAPGQGSFALTLHYRDDIDPASFKITPAAGGIKRLFNPQPGTTETVYLPLSAGKNLFRLSASTRFTPPGQDRGAGGGGREGPSKDIDDFEVRVPSSTDRKSPSDKAPKPK